MFASHVPSQESSSSYLGTCCRPDPVKCLMPLAGAEHGDHLFLFSGTRCELLFFSTAAVTGS